MKPSEVLRAARDLASYEKFEVGPYWMMVTVARSGLALHTLEVECGSALATWFDALPRTPQDVRALLDRAIAAAEARGE